MPVPKQKIKFLTSTDGLDGVLTTKYADIETIKFLPDNIKAHDIEFIKASITEHGFVEPIGINRTTGHDIFGNGRLETLLEMLRGGEKCPKGIVERLTPKNSPRTQGNGRKWYAPIVDGLEFDVKEELDLAIKMNKTSESGGIDVSKALDILTRLKTEDPERFHRTGYDSQQLDHIRAIVKFNLEVKNLETTGNTEGIVNNGSQEPESDESFAAELNKKWRVEYGDKFRVGRHTLYCMDSTNAEAICKESPGQPRLTFTSPPYDKQRSYEAEISDWTVMMNGVMTTIQRLSGDPSDIVVNLGPVYADGKMKFYWNDWLEFCDTRLDLPCYGEYIWDKLLGYPGEYHGRLARAHEYLFHFSIGHASARKWIKTTGESVRRGLKSWSARQTDGTLRENMTSPDKAGQPYKIPDSVVRMFSEKARGIHTKGHPATFPVDLPAYFMLSYTDPGDLVYEPFAGSGTTIVAAEESDRVCYASEISVNYCALILERFKTLFPEQEITKL